MKVLIDHGTPAPLRRHLTEHYVDRSAKRGWELLENENLIRKVEWNGHEVMVTRDQYMGHLQDLTGSSLGIVVQMPAVWPRVWHGTKEIRDATWDVRPGQVREVPI